MKYAILAALSACLMSTSALADCSVVAESDKGKVYQCDMPPQAAGPVRCTKLSGVLLCNGEIGQDAPATNVVKPTNCGYRKGQYVCW